MYAYFDYQGNEYFLTDRLVYYWINGKDFLLKDQNIAVPRRSSI